MSARFTLIASLIAAALGASSAAQAQYTIKLGGAYIDPHATSESLRGGVSARPLGGYMILNDGVAFEVQSKSTMILAIERALTDDWSVEFVLGTPPSTTSSCASTTPRSMRRMCRHLWPRAQPQRV